MRKKLLVSLLLALTIVAPTCTIVNAKTPINTNVQSRFTDYDNLDLYGFTYSRQNNLFTIDIHGGSARNSGYGMNIVSISEVNGTILVKVKFTTPSPKYHYLDVMSHLYTTTTFESATATRVQVISTTGSNLPLLD